MSLIGPEGIVKINSEPRIIHISKGNLFDTSEEYQDALEWNKLKNKELGPIEYTKAVEIRDKYGI